MSNIEFSVLFDISVLGLSRINEAAKTGVYRVVENLAYGLASIPQIRLSFCSTLNMTTLAPHVNQACQQYLAENPRLRCIPFFSDNLPDADIFHSPYSALPQKVKTQVRFLTVHDLIAILFPNFFPPTAAQAQMNCLSMLRPDDHLFSTSYATKMDICRVAGISSDRITITHLAADPELFHPVNDKNKTAIIRAKFGIGEAPYILSLCTLEPRKNIDLVIRAFAQLVRSESIGNTKLVLTGTKGWSFEKIFREIDNNPELTDRIILTGFIEDSDLAPLYSNASVFVYMSLYEGFGLPPLEAMQCGVPIITSNTSSLPEVVRDAGIMLDPHDENGLRSAIIEIISNKRIHLEYSIKSLKQAQYFSWERTIQNTVSAYKKALNNSKYHKPQISSFSNKSVFQQPHLAAEQSHNQEKSCSPGHHNKKSESGINTIRPGVTVHLDSPFSSQARSEIKHKFSGKTEAENNARLSIIPPKILFIRTDSIGDSILALSMLPHIKARYPGASLTVLCQKHIAELYETSPYCDSITTFDRGRLILDEPYRLELQKKLQSENFDLCLNSVYSRELVNDFTVLASGANVRIGHEGDLSNMNPQDRESNNRGYSRLVHSKGDYKLELERHRDFLKSIGIEAPTLEPRLWLTDNDFEFADRTLGEAKFDQERTIVLFAGVQVWIRRFERYGEILRDFCREQDYSVIALGSQTDFALNQLNLDALVTRYLNLSGKVTLRQSAAIISRCRLAVGAETGLAHMACAVGTPNVILLGGGHFGRFMPYSPLTSIVCLPLECYGCNWQCRYARPHCITDIAPGVFRRALNDSLISDTGKPRMFTECYDSYHRSPDMPGWGMFNNLVPLSQVKIIPVGDAE